MKIGFFVGDFPLLSQQFIVSQIVGLMRRGHDIEIDALSRRQADTEMGVEFEKFGVIERTKFSGEIPRAWSARTWSALNLIGHWGWRQPAAVLGSVNFLRHRKRALNLVQIHEQFPKATNRRLFDIIHCHFGPHGQRALFLRDIGAVHGPIITSFHGYDVNSLPRSYGMNIYRKLFQKTELFTAGSNFMRDRLISLGAPADRTIVLPLGVDLSRFEFQSAPSHSQDIELITVARLVEVKGIEFALRAVALARNELSNLHYTVIGDGPLRSQLESLTRQLNIQSVVTFKGARSQDEVARALTKAQIFVFPGIVTASGEEEGQGLAIAEAQACGVPVLTTPVGGIPESVCDGQTAILVPPGNPAAMAASIINLAKNPNRRAYLSQNGRALVQTKFNLETQTDRLIKIYECVSNNN